jgi:hypothetical protein
LRFDDEAQKAFQEWSVDLHAKIETEEHPLIAQHLAKFDKLFPALALIFHLIDLAMMEDPFGDVSKDAALRAAAWCDYLEDHARRCYGLLVDDGLRAAQALAIKVEKGAMEDGFTARDVRRHQWRYLTTDDAVQGALDWLIDEGWLRSEDVGGTGPGSGRKTQRHSINPVLRRQE